MNSLEFTERHAEGIKFPIGSVQEYFDWPGLGQFHFSSAAHKISPPASLLHLKHAITRFSRPFDPPLQRGITWSTVARLGACGLPCLEIG